MLLAPLLVVSAVNLASADVPAAQPSAHARVAEAEAPLPHDSLVFVHRDERAAGDFGPSLRAEIDMLLRPH